MRWKKQITNRHCFIFVWVIIHIIQILSPIVYTELQLCQNKKKYQEVPITRISWHIVPAHKLCEIKRKSWRAWLKKKYRSFHPDLLKEFPRQYQYRLTYLINISITNTITLIWSWNFYSKRCTHVDIYRFCACLLLTIAWLPYLEVCKHNY